MIHMVAKSIAVFLCKEAVIDNEDKEIYQYGIEVFVSNVIGIVLILLVSLFTGCLWQGFIYVTAIATLRVYTGGYHADTYMKCNFYNMCTYLITLGIYLLLKDVGCKLCLWILVLLGFLVIVAVAPVENPNKLLTDDDKKRMKKMSLIIYAVVMLAMMVSDIVIIANSFNNIYFLGWAYASFYIKIVLCTIIILMFIGKIKNKQ